jgi:hypothetical protein
MAAMGNRSTDNGAAYCPPLSATALVAQLQQNGQPAELTINGQAKLVVQDAESFQKLLELVDRLETIAGIQRSLEDMAAGRGRPAGEVLEEIQQKCDTRKGA